MDSLVDDAAETTQQKRDRISSKLALLHPNLNVTSPMAYKPILTKATLPPGATGLQNLGNTCFMNSAVQCLSHTVPLTSYFLTDHWKSNLNDTNPLGMKGEIAKVWASVVEHLWRCSEYRQPVFAPRDFKFKMGELIPTFHGYGQQDSHELLQTLLDGLHEDVNRILKKEYVEDPEKGDMTEENFAKVSWECYLKRNNSIIVDIFQAQLKNRTECQVCHNESIKFDPYMYLQLPIPEAEFICRELIAVGAAPWLLPTRTAVKIPRRSTVADLKIAVALQLGWSENAKRDSSFSHCVELFNMKIHLIINDDFSVAHIPASDIICIYELDELHPDILSLGNIVKSAPSELTKVAVCLTDFDETQSMYHTSRPFAPPLLLTFPSLIVLHEPIPEDSKDSAMGQIAYRLIVSKLERYSKMPMYRKLGSKFEYSLDGNEKDADELVWAADQDAEPIPGMFKVKIKIGYQLSEIYPKVKLSTASQKVVHDTSELPFPQPAPKSPVSEFSDLANNMDEKLICGITSIAELSREFQFPNNAELVTEFDSTFKEGFFGAKNSSGVPAKFEPLSDQTVNDMLAEPEHRSITLEQCISEFNKTEMLDGADTMYCSKCKDHQPTKKCLSVYSTPDVLILNSDIYHSTEALFDARAIFKQD